MIATPQCPQIFGWAERNHPGRVDMWGTWCAWWHSVNSPITLYLWCLLLKGSFRPQRGLPMASRVASSSSPLGSRSFTRWKDLETKQTPAKLIRWRSQVAPYPLQSTDPFIHHGQVYKHAPVGHMRGFILKGHWAYVLESLDELVQIARVQRVSEVRQVAVPCQICLENTGTMKTSDAL